MKFLVQWKINHLASSSDRDQVMTMFGQMTPEDDAAQLGSEIKQLARWHDASGSGQGGGLFESDSGVGLNAFFSQWAGVFEATITPVIDDEELRANIRASQG